MIHIRKVSDTDVTKGMCVYICVYLCVYIKLHITAQSGTVILAILFHSHWSFPCVCVCVCVSMRAGEMLPSLSLMGA